jgi:hypothetical protein
MPQNLANELNSLDFGTLIGGPLQAAVNAQNDAALAQVNYIKAVGFDPITAEGDSSEIIGHSLKMVDFSYQEGTGSSATHYTFSMPLLSMLNIPALRIDEMTIDFNAKLTSVETAETDTSAAASAELGLSYGKLASLKASASYQKTTSTGSKVDKTYSMSIHVRVVNDEIPVGLERMLTMMENRIIEAPQPTTTPTP